MLDCQLLRQLTIHPQDHPRRCGHISAASGLVCAHGRAYVVADDEHHLAVFDDPVAPGRLHRLLPGALPHKKKARKRAKPDLEALILLPRGLLAGTDALVALGSGSRDNRQRGVAIVLDADGEPGADRQAFDLAALHAPLRELLGEINIEGALVQGDTLLLFNRGVAGRSDNAVARYPLRALLDLIDGAGASIAPSSLQRHRLGHIDGVPLGFTDAAALPGAGWLFTAVAEATDDSVADGPFRGAVLGRADAQGTVQWMRRVTPTAKVEGIDVQVDASGTRVCLVTDPDDMSQCAQMLVARW